MRAVVVDVLVAALLVRAVVRECVGALQPERLRRVDLVRRVVAARAGVGIELVAVVVVRRRREGRLLQVCQGPRALGHLRRVEVDGFARHQLFRQRKHVTVELE